MAGGVGRRQALVQHIRFPGRGGRMQWEAWGRPMLELIFGPRHRTNVLLTNLYDGCLYDRGHLDEQQVRSVGVLGAVVDTSVLSVTLPGDIIELLGLEGAGSGG